MEFGLLLCVISLSVYIAGGEAANISCPIQVYQFGDSISDTGNLPRIAPATPGIPNRLPYGQTFPGKPFGRSTDGRLIIDYISTSLGLPFLNPYLDFTASFRNGVNFAVGGATAGNILFFARMGVIVPPYSLDSQLAWFRQYLASICFPSTSGCAEKLRRSLFIVGELGINDINYQLMQGKSLHQIRSTLPLINQAITNTIRELIRVGAPRVLVPGNFPLGCFPFGIAALPTNDSNAYDSFGCLESLNKLVIYQNDNLQAQLSLLRTEFPGVNITYVDLYNAFSSVLREAHSMGFDRATLLRPCCGGATNNYNPFGLDFCGNPGASVCSNPEQYISWDGIHLTQETHRRISHIVIPQAVIPAVADICST